MNKKIIGVISVVALIILSFILFTNFNVTDPRILKQTFVIDAVYFEDNGFVEISFHDTSNKTNHVTLEILGMAESFHKTYDSSSFVEKIVFTSVPKYGWQSIPVTFLVEHEEFGKIGIKTEIRPIGENPATIIFSKL
jgi:hypothetical protein